MYSDESAHSAITWRSAQSLGQLELNWQRTELDCFVGRLIVAMLTNKSVHEFPEESMQWIGGWVTWQVPFQLYCRYTEQDSDFIFLCWISRDNNHNWAGVSIMISWRKRINMWLACSMNGEMSIWWNMWLQAQEWQIYHTMWLVTLQETCDYEADNASYHNEGFPGTVQTVGEKRHNYATSLPGN